MKIEELIEKILDKQIRPTTEGKGFSYNGFPLYHKLTEYDAIEIIELCQLQLNTGNATPPIESKPFNPHSPDCELRKE